MSSKWPIQKLADVCLKITDGAHQSPKSVTSGKPMASVKDLTRFGVDLSQARHISQEDFDALVKQGCQPTIGDVLIAKDGNSALDTVCNVDHPLDAVVLSSVAILRPDPAKVHPHFLKHYLASPDVIEYLKSNFISGAAIPRVVLRDFKKAEIKVPPLALQRVIVEILDSLDDRLALLRETNATLEAIAQALFKSWFVDLDPVRAKQEGRAPEGMDDATAALFTDEFEESELGVVPKGWKVQSVEDFTERVGMGPFGSNIKVDTFVPQGIPVISGQHLKQFLVEDNTFNFITTDHAARLAKSCVQSGDVVFTHAGSIGQVSLIHKDSDYPMYVLSQRQFFLRCNTRLMTPEWITHFFKSPGGQHKLLANTSQVGVPSIARPVSYLRSIRMVVPPPELNHRFASISGVIYDRVMANRKHINTLTQIRDTLLPRLISGQLRLPEAEAMAA